MKFLFIFFAILLALVLTGVGFAYSGFYNVSARSEHGGLSQWFLSATSHASIKRRSSDIDVPDLSGLAIIRAGVNDYESMCAGCHGAPGKSAAAIGLGLNPAPPDLSESAKHLSPAELFWVTKNGIRMTGMPAWGETHEDDAIWPVVALTAQLPRLDAEGYQTLLVESEGAGHHAEDLAPGHEEPPTSEAEKTKADGHDHEH